MRKASDIDAAAAVEEFSENGGEIELFGSPAYLWERQFPSGSLEFNYRYLKAQLGCWFIAAQSFDDTGFRYAYHPLAMSAVVADAFTEELLARCE